MDSRSPSEPEEESHPHVSPSPPLPPLLGANLSLGLEPPRRSAFKSLSTPLMISPVKREQAPVVSDSKTHLASTATIHNRSASSFHVYSKLIDSAAAVAAATSVAGTLRYGELTAGITSLNRNRSPTFSFGSTNSVFSRRRRKETRQRRQRTTFTSDQTLKLEMEYHRTEYITRVRRVELAEHLNLTETQIKIWFQNRRAKDKRIEKAQLDQQYRSMGLPAPGCSYTSTYPGFCGACYYPSAPSINPTAATIGRPYHQLSL